MVEVKDLLPVALIFIVVGVALSIGASLIEDVQEDVCQTGDTWVTLGTIASGHLGGNNPVTGAKYGCCQTGGTNCTVWRTNDYAVNASHQSNLAIDEISGWQSTIALVIVAAIIIGILIGALYVRFGRGEGF